MVKIAPQKPRLPAVENSGLTDYIPSANVLQSPVNTELNRSKKKPDDNMDY